ncbi:uncharacterized protein LOC100168878 [Acyrthosiphon pisum]|uniref:Peptidase C45 hydrolase domain-containing protein n=1 Tax=Acyrthosiphon pisum TaxID=7029 RepID=A0A8R1VY85_ACYPI|nr:uncharacterized protein LOC100168878 [Acyrthosiphon pisum]XP_016660334.1 uncharacterized protein LOC100168878 [Acyrthosiphon pisum]XP_029342966.1 uncharacterized protein LOC100168878 [Acyrthosiphon pisum]|eukprot:XP_001942958.2 PREDICTED: uncharacterized protein LOC100168878 [Acyrthosiphon pisum]
MLAVAKSVSVVACLIWLSFSCIVDQVMTSSATYEPESESCCPPVSPRQNSIPVHYVEGTHYEVGYSVGRTFGGMIKEFVSVYKPLQEEYLKLYAQPEGRQIYEESLNATKKYFPQYVIEMKGLADGSGVPFYELFLMALDDTLPRNMNVSSKDRGAVGCTSIFVNQPNVQLLGHTEDAVSESLNNYYVVAAHVKPGKAERGGIFAAREEKFEAITYAGHLSGYASGHNHCGLVFAIDTLYLSKPLRGKIPREFITRALLSARSNMNDIVKVLTNEGAGTADGFSVNIGFLNEPKQSRVFHTVEVTPKMDSPRSAVYVSNFSVGTNSLHTNILLHLKYPELSDSAGVTSSVAREKRYKKLTANGQVTNLKELLTIFGNREDQPWPIFSDAPDASEKTINFGVFDFNKKTWTMWTSNPVDNPPLLQLPLTFSDLISP